MGVGLVVMTSFDRLFSVLFPRVHTQMNKVLYMGGILLICAAYTTYIITISYINITDKKDIKVVCLIVEAMHGDPATIWAASTCGSTLVAVVNYGIVGLCIKLKIGNSNTTQRLFKSLSIMTTMMMCSWFLTCVSMVIVVALGSTEEQIFYTPLYTGITINVACGANFFVLFKFR
uniref:G_PROTEIN_RECEP_F1_2 domain-containing protein n=1 Tax=Panagrellus redivivus TaxID=6233 RepID=A0A7E4UZV4_PANRE